MSDTGPLGPQSRGPVPDPETVPLKKQTKQNKKNVSAVLYKLSISFLHLEKIKSINECMRSLHTSTLHSGSKKKKESHGVSTQLQSSGLVAHENSTFRNLALAVSGPFTA